ncbi:MAG: hypothetical protein ACRDK4_10915 [Solirubrobacteraceae bacterium]
MSGRITAGALALFVLAFAGAGAGALAGASSSTAQTDGSSESAHITATLSPNRLSAAARMNIDISYGQAGSELPPPVRHALLRLPAALGIDIPTLRACSAAHLRAHGAHGCPPQSLIGTGQALTDALLGSQLLSEHVALSLFVGPLVNLEPTFEILAEALTPFHERVVILGRVLADDPPFGEDLSIALPPIRTLPLEPYASIVSLSLSIGPRPGARSGESNAVLVPARCPPGGFPFAIESSFADGDSSKTLTNATCPR